MKKVILFVFVALLVCPGCTGSRDRNDAVAPSATAQQFVTSTPTPLPQATPDLKRSVEAADVEIIATRANLRASPNSSSDVVKELVKGDQLTLLANDAEGAWYNVRDLATGKSGWVHGNSIRNISAAQGKSTKAETTAQQNEAQVGRNENSASRSSDTYTNVDGDQVQRPRKSATAPEGASAKCRDGSYSFSRHRQGTCSHHGGVAEWL